MIVIAEEQNRELRHRLAQLANHFDVTMSELDARASAFELRWREEAASHETTAVELESSRARCDYQAWSPSLASLASGGDLDG